MYVQPKRLDGDKDSKNHNNFQKKCFKLVASLKKKAIFASVFSLKIRLQYPDFTSNYV